MELINVYEGSGKLDNGNPWHTYYLQLVYRTPAYDGQDISKTGYRIDTLKISEKLWNQISDKSPYDLIKKDVTIFYDNNKHPLAIQVK